MDHPHCVQTSQPVLEAHHQTDLTRSPLEIEAELFQVDLLLISLFLHIC